ncbi:MAG TPA: hypothetical protein VG992_05025 [Candidatus Saccharimonadales bacterium]|nr:hypothetical protein [Candidatus Saccharimonadales bacterium]
MSFAGGEVTALIVMGILLLVCAVVAWLWRDDASDIAAVIVAAVIILILFLSATLISGHDRDLELKAEKNLSAQGFQVLSVEYNFWTDPTVKVVGKSNCIAKYYIERDIRGWHIVDGKKLVAPATVNCADSTS